MGSVIAKALLPATVGEWVQGWIGGQEALVSLVVEWRGSVELRKRTENAFEELDAKALAAFHLAQKVCGEKALRDIFPVVCNPLPRAKGFATSTMDIAGVLAACIAYAKERWNDEELFSLCASIEPSDGIMFEGLALVDHVSGRLIERLPPPPDMELLVIVPGRTLDTAEYRRDKGRVEAVRTLAADHEHAYTLLKTGLLKGDASSVAEAATISASLQQKILPYDEWELLREGKNEFGALGFAIAHSGTASALIFNGDDEVMFAAERWLFSRLGGTDGVIARTRACGGGVTLLM